VDGPILSVLVALPNRTRFTPFVEVGRLFVTYSSVEINPAWGNAHGIDGYQTFEIVNTKDGSVLGVGCSIQLSRSIEMDVIYRQIKASVVVDHILLDNVQNNDREFPLDSSWLGAGVQYRF
jgi:opacity protein-like surface antigen